MKYRVVGWTYYENNEVLDSGNRIGFAERNAIIDEIRKHKYMFSGWHHQESWDGVVPILNDGKKRCFSQRGWGGVMAEAYEEMEDYSYVGFSFHQSVSSDQLKFAPDDFDINEFEAEAVENEHFRINVNEGLFNIAKTSNPFYLEDIDELRSIDVNDVITLCCNNEELTFVVKDIDRNKAEINFKNASDLIKGKYKIIVTHKPECERVLPKKPLISSRSKAFELFKEALVDYNYDIINEALDLFDLGYLTQDLEKKDTTKSLTRFVKEYTDQVYKTGKVDKILKYLNKYKLFEEVINKTLEKDKVLYISFINYYLEKNKNMDEHILKFISYLKPNEDLFSGSLDILLKAISLKPEDSKLRKVYYKSIKNSRRDGLYIMAGGGLFKNLRKEDKHLIEIDKYASYSDEIILKIVEYLTYPNTYVKANSTSFYTPDIYKCDKEIVEDGVKAYQKYIKEHFDLDSIFEDMILCGIDKKCFEMDKYFRGEEYAAKYIWSMDVLTDYKYNLKDKAIKKYADKYKDFLEELEDAYK